MNNFMNMNMAVILAVDFFAGMVLGTFYFIGLWRTVRQLPSVKSPAHLLLGSLILRMAVVMAVFYFIMGTGHWERLAAAMLGFIIAKKILTYRLGPQKAVEMIN